MFLAFFVFDAQFVEAAAARRTQGLEGTAGFVRRQVVGNDVFLVVQAAADQWLVGIAFEEGHQHFHADTRDGDAAVVCAGQAEETRSQQLVLSSDKPSLSQKNCTFTRPYWSQWISSPLGPVTTALWLPRIRGLG